MKRIFEFTAVAVVLAALGACAPATPAASPQPSSTPSEAVAATTMPEPTAAALAPTTQPSAMPEILIDALDFSYKMPESISAGWVRVKLTNSGQEPHHVQFLRLNDGATFEQFKEALKQGEGPALALVKQMGGVGVIAPTGAAQVVLNLSAGRYVLICFVPSPDDNVPHFAKGMIQPITVQEATGAGVQEPTADFTVTLKDFAFDLPETLPAGPTTIKVVNDGPEPHEMNLLRLADGKTTADVMQYLGAPAGPPPFTPVGGMNGLDPGSVGYVEFDFKPGNYVAICNIPSPKAGGRPHFALGMIKEFTVASPKFTYGTYLNGATELQLKPDGTFSIKNFDQIVDHGTFSIQGNQFTWETSSYCDPGGKATYTWTYQNAILVLKANGTDHCSDRTTGIDGIEYRLKP